jgi:hypothetical protein
MSKKPTGFVATCQCGVHLGALDLDRTDRSDASRLLGVWLMKGCTVTPMFGGNWSVSLEACTCPSTAHQGGDGPGKG